MFIRPLSIVLVVVLFPIVLHAQPSVCDLFEDLVVAGQSQKITIKGELFLSGKVAALGAADCDNEFVASRYRWPNVINLRPAAALSDSMRKAIKSAEKQIRKIKNRGKLPRATAVISGQLLVRTQYSSDSKQGGSVGNAFGPKGIFPAELVYDDVRELVVEELPGPDELPVIPICDIFQDLVGWKGKRVAVLAEIRETGEGAWLVGDCRDKFQTNGLQWSASFWLDILAYYSSDSLEALFNRDRESIEKERIKAAKVSRGRYSVETVATFVGTLHVRDEYFAECREDGSVFGMGYGHLGGAPAELILEAERDLDVRPLREPVYPGPPKCQPPDFEARCNSAASLEDAAELGCTDSVRQFLNKDGIDSKGPEPSSALQAAIWNGHEAVVELLIAAGAPVNPDVEFDYQTPLADAARKGGIEVLRLLIKAGLKVDRKNSKGETFLATFGFFDDAVTRELLKAGADPNSRDKEGATALMQASAYGFENVVQLLIEHGAEVDATDANGRTALMYAAEGTTIERHEYHVDAIPLLLAHGANASRRDSSGRTALDIATKLKHTYAVELLKPARH